MSTAPPEPDVRGGGGAEDSRTGESAEAQDRVWRRDFTLLMGGSAFSQLGTLGAAAANPLLALALTDSPIVAGWVAAASTLPGLFLHLPAGLIADRCDRRRIMLRSQLIRVLNSIVLFVGLFTVPEPWPFLVVAAVVDGSCAVFFRIAEMAAVRHVVPDGEAENAMGKSEARHHLALVLGRPVGGLLFSLGHAFPYVLDALTSFVSVVSLRFLRTKHLQSFEPTRGSGLRGPMRKMTPYFKEGFGWISRDRFLCSSIVACAVANIGFQIIILLLVVEAERNHLSGSLIGTLLATSGVSGFLGAMTAPGIVRRFRPQATVKWCVAAWLPFVVIVAMTGDPVIGMCAWGACSFMGAYINVALAVHQSKAIPKDVLGRVEGVLQFLTTGAVTLGASASGYVIKFFGPRPTAFLVAGTFLGIVAAVLCLVRRPNPAGEPTLVTLLFFFTLVAVWSLPRPDFRWRRQRARWGGRAAAGTALPVHGAAVPAGEDG
ncbi:MFS transporter [Actinomadura nitritigenes]|uniref:MFS transporter n=1 Tax=Actinomadura nitritigenes TaxID=134602 RepID=UPI003D920008